MVDEIEKVEEDGVGQVGGGDSVERADELVESREESSVNRSYENDYSDDGYSGDERSSGLSLGMKLEDGPAVEADEEALEGRDRDLRGGSTQQSPPPAEEEFDPSAPVCTRRILVMGIDRSSIKVFS